MTSATWIPLGAVADFPPETPQRRDVGERRLCVVRVGDDFHVLDDLCTHGRSFLSEGFLDVEEGVLECALHGGLFDFRDGRAVGTPACRDLAVHPTKIVEGVLHVGLDPV